MISLQGNERLFISEDLLAFTKKLDADGTIPRMIDFLFLGFGFAIQQELMPADSGSYTRQPLIPVINIDPEMMLSIEASAHWYAQKKDLDLPNDAPELLLLICSIGIAGCRGLEER